MIGLSETLCLPNRNGVENNVGFFEGSFLYWVIEVHFVLASFVFITPLTQDVSFEEVGLAFFLRMVHVDTNDPRTGSTRLGSD